MYLQWIKTGVIVRKKISKNYLLFLYDSSSHRGRAVNYEIINCFKKLRRKQLTEQVPLSYSGVLREIDCNSALFYHHSRWLNILHNLRCLKLSGNIWKLNWHFGVEFIWFSPLRLHLVRRITQLKLHEYCQSLLLGV
jgi:hypothetical protein